MNQSPELRALNAPISAAVARHSTSTVAHDLSPPRTSQTLPDTKIAVAELEKVASSPRRRGSDESFEEGKAVRAEYTILKCVGYVRPETFVFSVNPVVLTSV